MVFADTPSRLVPYPAACPPPRMKPLSPPTFFASGVSAARLNGLRIAAADHQRKLVHELVIHR